MKSFVHSLGRALQFLALLVLPSSIWAGSLGHSEKQAILILVASIGIFYAGYFLTRFSPRI